MKRFALAYLLLVSVGCAAATPTAIPPTLAPMVDLGATQTQAAQSVFATHTPSVPPATPTPRLTEAPALTHTPDASEQIPPRRKYNHSFVISEEYDKVKTYTVVSLEAKSMKAWPPDQNPNLSILYLYPETTPARPPFVNFQILRLSDTRRYLSCHDLTLWLDSNKRMTPDTQYHATATDGSFVEYVTATLSVSDFLHIVNAGRVEGSLCDDKFTFDAELFQALRDVASRMKP